MLNTYLLLYKPNFTPVLYLKCCLYRYWFLITCCFHEWLSSDEVAAFEDLVDNLEEKMAQYLRQWSWKVLTDCMWLYLVNFELCPCVVCCVKVCRDMTVSVYVNGVREHDSRFTWVFGTDCSMKLWSQLENIFSHNNCAQPRTVMQGDLSLAESVSVASNILTSALQKVNVECGL